MHGVTVYYFLSFFGVM